MDQRLIVQKVIKYIRENPPKSRGSREVYLRHVLEVRKCALGLATVYQADKFVIELAALLHDSRGDAGDEHAEEGARFSNEFLAELGVPKIPREKVSQCIKTHSMGSKAETLEAQILQDADGITFIQDTFKAYFEIYKLKLPLEKARETSLRKTRGMVAKIKTKAGAKLANNYLPQAIKWLKAAQ